MIGNNYAISGSYLEELTFFIYNPLEVLKISYYNLDLFYSSIIGLPIIKQGARINDCRITGYVEIGGGYDIDGCQIGSNQNLVNKIGPKLIGNSGNYVVKQATILDRAVLKNSNANILFMNGTANVNRSNIISSTIVGRVIVSGATMEESHILGSARVFDDKFMKTCDGYDDYSPEDPCLN